jgi:hypothetical protein
MTLTALTLSQRSARLGWRHGLASVLLGLGVASAALAAPFVPASDGEVVETLKRRLLPGIAGEDRAALRARRLALQQQPQDLGLALQAARAAIDRARQAGDPRELGQAQAALAPWWTQAAPPAPVRVLRATIRQSQHDFASALTDLDAVLADPRAPLALQAQAGLTRASLLQVQGRYAEADAACAQLLAPRYSPLGASVSLPAEVCRAELMSLTGRAAQGDAALATLATRGGTDLAGWLALVRAELAERRGRPQAGALYQQALQAQTDVYTLAAYADWLLDRQRAREVLTLLQGREDADALLLRLAIAQQRLGDAAAPSSIATLQERFDAARQRGDSTHRREEARFELELRQRPAPALALAQANWALQKEPADARLLRQAAQAAGQPDAAQPVQDFVRATGLADVRLSAPLPAPAASAAVR